MLCTGSMGMRRLIVIAAVPRLPAYPWRPRLGFATVSERTPETAPTIRRAVRGDARALGRLGALMVQEHHDFDARRFLAPGGGTAEHYGAFLASQVDEPDAAVLVAEGASR